jgi:hypothetical protein
MKKYIVYALTAFFAATVVSFAAPPDKSAIEAKEKAAWQAFKDRKADDFKKVVSANIRAVYAEGMSDMQKELDDMKKWDMKSFAISDYTATPIGNDIVLTTYKVAIEGTYDGKDMSGTYNAGSVWAKEKGTWMGIFHTNIKVAEAGATTATSPAGTP